MAETSLSIRVPVKTKSKLDALAKASRLPRSVLAGKAISEFVDRETAIRRGIERAIKELDAGLGVPHEEAMRQMKEVIAKARGKRVA